MMMKVIPNQQTRTICGAVSAAAAGLLSFLVFVLSFSLVPCTSAIEIKNGMATPDAYEKQQRMLKFGNESTESDKNTFSQTYISVTEAADFATRLANGGDTAAFINDFVVRALANPTTFSGTTANPEFPIVGSSFIQKGAIFGPDSVLIANDPDGVTFQGKQYQFAGNRKAEFTPVEDPFYFFHGQCIATSGFLEPTLPFVTRTDQTLFGAPQPVITSHLCRLNLCLGGGGFNCIAIYSGTAFVFNFGTGTVSNNAANPTAPCKKGTFEPPPLPPPFPGTIIGGTGSFEGIEGSVNIATIAGTTGPLLGEVGGNPVFFPPQGSIVQVISVKSNMALPPGP